MEILWIFDITWILVTIFAMCQAEEELFSCCFDQDRTHIHEVYKFGEHAMG